MATVGVLSECPICMEPFENSGPHVGLVLPCAVGHIICRSCLQQLTTSIYIDKTCLHPCQQGGNSCTMKNHIICPFCQCRFHLDFNNLIVAKWSSVINQVLKLDPLVLEMAGILMEHRRKYKNPICAVCNFPFEKKIREPRCLDCPAAHIICHKCLSDLRQISSSACWLNGDQCQRSHHVLCPLCPKQKACFHVLSQEKKDASFSAADSLYCYSDIVTETVDRVLNKRDAVRLRLLQVARELKHCGQSTLNELVQQQNTVYKRSISAKSVLGCWATALAGTMLMPASAAVLLPIATLSTALLGKKAITAQHDLKVAQCSADALLKRSRALQLSLRDWLYVFVRLEALAYLSLHSHQQSIVSEGTSKDGLISLALTLAELDLTTKVEASLGPEVASRREKLGGFNLGDAILVATQFASVQLLPNHAANDLSALIRHLQLVCSDQLDRLLKLFIL